jgi:hypothetical protein
MSVPDTFGILETSQDGFVTTSARVPNLKYYLVQSDSKVGLDRTRGIAHFTHSARPWFFPASRFPAAVALFTTFSRLAFYPELTALTLPSVWCN